MFTDTIREGARWAPQVPLDYPAVTLGAEAVSLLHSAMVDEDLPVAFRLGVALAVLDKLSTFPKG